MLERSPAPAFYPATPQQTSPVYLRCKQFRKLKMIWRGWEVTDGATLRYNVSAPDASLQSCVQDEAGLCSPQNLHKTNSREQEGRKWKRGKKSSVTLLTFALFILLQINTASIFPVYPRRVDTSASAFSLSSHRHSYISFLFSSRCIGNNKHHQVSSPTPLPWDTSPPDMTFPYST